MESEGKRRKKCPSQLFSRLAFFSRLRSFMAPAQLGLATIRSAVGYKFTMKEGDNFHFRWVRDLMLIVPEWTLSLTSRPQPNVKRAYILV